MFHEGGSDNKFTDQIGKISQFKYQTKLWSITTGSGSGGSPKVILQQCENESFGKGYDLIICFVDIDVLVKAHGKKLEREKNKLEQKYSNIKIIWQDENLEGEMRRVLKCSCHCNKQKVQRCAKKNIKKFINSIFWRKIIGLFHAKEKELENN
jgi:hypothetical protein